MIEEELVSLYKKTKKQLANLLDDFTFANFFRALQSGKRTYTLKNTQVTKTIDEEWVDAIKKAVPHLDNIVNNPRKYMKRETDVVPIEKARIVDSESVKHLASHTNFINSVENGFVRPNKILTAYNEESLELYENRFIMTLILKVSQFIDRRYFLLGTGGNEFSSTVDCDGEFEQAGETTSYKTHMTIHQGADYFDGGMSSKVYEDLFTIRKYVTSFRYSPFMRVLGSAPQVRGAIVKTNLLTKEPNYRACVELWDFIENYNRVGYKIEIIDSAPFNGRDLTDDLDSVNMLAYVQLKRKMGEYDKRRRGMFQVQKKVIKPLIEDYEPTDEITIEPTLNMGLKASINGKHKKDMDAAIKDVLLRALRKERVKREMELAEKKARDAATEKLLKNALKIKSDSEKMELEFKAGILQSVKDALKIEQENMRKQHLEQMRKAQPALKLLKRELDSIERDEFAMRQEKMRQDSENTSLMNVILKDLLRIEEERDYIRTSPLVIKGGEYMPVPVIENRLPAQIELAKMYEDMFTPPLTVDNDDWLELQTLKNKKLGRRKRTGDNELKNAISRALKLERKRVSDLNRFDDIAERQANPNTNTTNLGYNNTAESFDDIAERQANPNANTTNTGYNNTAESFDDIAEGNTIPETNTTNLGYNDAIEGSGDDTSNSTHINENGDADLQNDNQQKEAAATFNDSDNFETKGNSDKHGHGGHGKQDDRRKNAPVPSTDEKLTLWRRIIRFLFGWMKK